MKEGWEIKKLGEVCRYAKNQGLHSGLPYIGMEDIVPSSNETTASRLPKSVKSATFNFKSGMVLFGRLRPYLRKVIVADFDGHCSTEIFPIETSEAINPFFLRYWFALDRTIDSINGTCTGARMPRANMNEVMNFDIPVPSIAEQQRIVDILDSEFEKIEQLKVNATQSLENVQALFQTALKQELSPRDGWISVFLPEISQSLDNRRAPITKGNRMSGTYPYYGASGIVDYVKDFIFDDELLLISEDGANLLARSRPIAFSISGKTWVNNHAHVLKFDNLITQRYVELYFQSIKIDKYVTGAAQPKLNQKSLN